MENGTGSGFWEANVLVVFLCSTNSDFCSTCCRLADAPARQEFLTTEPNAEVKSIHPKAMVILTTQSEVETWLTASTKDAMALQRPLPAGALRIVARGLKMDAAPEAELAAV